MESNKIVVVLGGDSTTGSGLAVSYARNINTMYLNSHLYNEFVVRPQFELGTAETMWVTFTRKGAAKPLKTLLMAARKKTEDVEQIVDGTSSTTEKTSYDGWEYYLRLPDAITLWQGAWQFSFTIAELPYVVKYKGTVDSTSDLPTSGNAIGDTYFVSEEDKYYVWSGTAWGELTVTAVSTSDVGEFTVNASVSAPLGAPTDLDIQVMYSQIVDMLQNTQNYLPKVGSNGNWQTYTSSGYVDSGVRADGTQMFTVTSGTTITTASNQLVAVSAILVNKTGQKIQIGDFIVATVADTERLGLLRIKGFNAAADKVFGNFEGYITGEKGADGADGAKGDTGVGVQSITSENVTGGVKVSITLTDGTVSEFTIETDVIFGGISAIDFPYGTPTLTYDTTDGMHINGVFRMTVNGTNYDVPFDQELPIVFGDGLTADVAQDGESVGVKVNGTVFRTSGGTINGNVTIGGNLNVQGTTTTVDSEHLKVKDKLIIVADGNTVKLTSPAGLLAPKYDGTNSGALVFDGDGTAYVGDVVLTADGEIDVTASDLQPLATRGTLVNGNLVQWNGTALRLEDSGKKVSDFASKDDVAKASGLLYLQSYESGNDPTVGTMLTLSNSNFSHTPKGGDKFQLLEIVNSLNAWESVCNVLTVGATNTICEIIATTDITGAVLDEAKKYTDDNTVSKEQVMGWIETESVTYANLVFNRDHNSLLAGQFYRITDYTCTTTQAETQSAGHAFDIIVRADETNKLNENAWAVKHSGDTYFDGCKLEAWQLKYCLDNDTTRFAWADTTNGKGIIYWLKDEWGNECPYDFKNIQFKRYKITACPKSPDLVGTYSCKGITGITVDENDFIWCYTFSYFDDVATPNVMYDATLKGNDGTLLSDEGYVNGVFDNKINATSIYYLPIPQPENEGLIFALNNIVCLSTQSFTNSGAYYGCYYNTFGNNCYSNTFGNNCYSNTFGNNCSSNTFGNDCSSNTFGNNCYYNTFGNNCSSNTFENDCSSNTFGNDCYSNTFGNNCPSNTFENDCYSNTFGNDCYSNTFGNDCYSNTFGNSVQSSTTTGVQLQKCFLQDGVRFVKFTNSATVTVQGVIVETKIEGSSSSNQLELYDSAVSAKTYPITYSRASNNYYTMTWNADGSITDGKYKATATAASWTAMTKAQKEASQSYVDSAISTSITTALNTPV